MKTAGWSILAVAVCGALTWSIGRAGSAPTTPDTSSTATVLASVPAFGMDTEVEANPWGALAMGYWDSALVGETDVRVAALQQLELLLRMPQAQSWSVAAILLSRGALDVAEDGGRWPRSLRGKAATIASLGRERLTEIDSGPPTSIGVHELEFSEIHWQQGARTEIEETRELRLEASADCHAKVAYLTRSKDGNMVSAGVLSMQTAQQVLVEPGTTVLRGFSKNACHADSKFSLTFGLPSAPLPEAGGLLALDVPYAFDMPSGGVQRFRIPNEVGVVYGARTNSLSEGADTKLSLFGRADELRGEDDDGNDGLGSHLHWIGDGQPLELEVAVLDGGEGQFTLDVRAERVANLTDKEIAQRSVAAGHWYQIRAKSSGRIQVDVDPVGDLDPVVMAFAIGSTRPTGLNDDRNDADLGATLEVWLGAGESIWLLVGTRAEEGEYKIRATPMRDSPIAGNGRVQVSDVRSLVDLRVLSPGLLQVVNFEASAGTTYLIAGRTEGLSLRSSVQMTLLGEHSLSADAATDDQPARVSVTCWQAQSDGNVEISIGPGALGVPLAVGRRAVGSGLCPSVAAQFNSMPTVAGSSRSNAALISLNSSTEVSLPTGAHEAWLVLPKSALSRNLSGIEYSLRTPGSIAKPRGFQVRFLDALTGSEVTAAEGCGLQLLTLNPERDYLIAIRSDAGFASRAAIVLDLQGRDEHGGLKVGDRVVVHRHYLRQGRANWTRKMDDHVGKIATVEALVEGSTGEQLMRLDIDESGHVWRSESLVPVGI